MPQSDMMMLLMQLQMDLNSLTLSCIETNSCVTSLLELYSDKVQSYTTIHDRCVRWSRAIGMMSDALEKFQADANKLGDYLDAQG